MDVQGGRGVVGNGQYRTKGGGGLKSQLFNGRPLQMTPYLFILDKRWSCFDTDRQSKPCFE